MQHNDQSKCFLTQFEYAKKTEYNPNFLSKQPLNY